MSDLRITSSNYVDKVCFKYSGSRSVTKATNSAGAVLETVPHGLPFVPQCIGIYSDVSNFSVHHELDQPPFDYISSVGLYGPDLECSVKADATNIYIQLRNWRSTRTMYYKIVGIIPPDVTEAEALSTALRDNTLLDSDDNFLKIAVDSYQDVVLTGSASKTFEVTHGLGYRPMVVAYTQRPSSDPFSPLRTYRAGAENSFGVEGIFSKLSVDSSKLTFTVDSVFSTTLRCFYRIYLDD